jgi:hypothetical protein
MLQALKNIRTEFPSMECDRQSNIFVIVINSGAVSEKEVMLMVHV